MAKSIKELRVANGLTQQEVSEMVGMPLRTYKYYENDPSRVGSIKYEYIVGKLEEYGFIDESHGILKNDNIVSVCNDVFKDYDISYCYLFGSYAKGTATEKSDVDLLISAEVSGIRFYGLAERLRESLRKNVDLINVEQLKDNTELLNEILKDGVKIYAKGQ